MRKIRYAVVGAGFISQEAFMPAIDATGNSVMTAIVSGSPGNARKLADFYGIQHVATYREYDRLLAEDVVDAVYIALPNSMHADYSIRAARARKHVLVEKPLAPSIEDCETMIAAAEENAVYLMTAYRLHNEPGTLAVLERIRAGEIGDPRIFSSVFGFMIEPTNHRLKESHWGGPLQDLGVYCLNAARHIFGSEPIEAMAMVSMGHNNPKFTEVEESIAVTLRFPEGRLAQFVASFGTGMTDSYTVVGTEGCLSLNPGFRFEIATSLTIQEGDEFSGTTFPLVDHFAGQTAYFSDCILSGTPPEADGHEGLADVRALLAIERAVKTARPQAIQSPPRPRHPTPDMQRLLPMTERRLRLD